MDSLEERIKEMRQRYARKLPEIVAEISTLMRTGDRKVARAALLDRFHTLAGTAGTFGYEAIATLAGEAEQILSSNPAPEVTPGELGQLIPRMAHLEEACRTPEVIDESRHTTWSTFEGGGVV